LFPSQRLIQGERDFGGWRIG